MTSACPFAKPGAGDRKCPVRYEKTDGRESAEHRKGEKDSDPAVVSPKCPFGYDSHTFKLGPLSCMICQALLYESSKCLPCSHKFCKACISRFKDCPCCGADIEKIESDEDLQVLVERFIDGHARIKRSQPGKDDEGAYDSKRVIYEDISMERGAFLVQQAVRAFRAKNFESAKSRLGMCAEDIREQLRTSPDDSALCSQLGAVLGMLGDCCRSMGDSAAAIGFYEETVEFLSKITTKDLELVHTLSVSLNKIGDLQYYNGDLLAARNYYTQSLNVRREAAKEHSAAPSHAIDVATSLAKVADVDRNLGNEKEAVERFEEAIRCLESLKLDPNEQPALEHKRRSVLDFLQNQVADKQDSK